MLLCNSVGYKTDYVMRSMDFEEFLWAKGYGDDFVGEMLKHIADATPFSELEMRVYQSLFTDFCILGGMPGVVVSYIENQTFSGVLDMQRQLILDYEEDVRKYVHGLDQTRIMNVMHHIPKTIIVSTIRQMPTIRIFRKKYWIFWSISLE